MIPPTCTSVKSPETVSNSERGVAVTSETDQQNANNKSMHVSTDEIVELTYLHWQKANTLAIYAIKPVRWLVQYVR